MVRAGHFPIRRSVHDYCPGLVCIAINRFRDSDWSGSILLSVANNHIESIDGKTSGSLSAAYNHGDR